MNEEALAMLMEIRAAVTEIQQFVRTVAAVAGPMLPPGTIPDVQPIQPKPW